MVPARAHLPMQAAIEAYGNGGFRFGGMSHKGSILCLPTGIWEWPVASLDDFKFEALSDVLALRDRIPLLFLGTGREIAPVSRELRAMLKDAGIWVEVMDTGAAARTYNVLLAEARPIAAALLAVE